MFGATEIVGWGVELLERWMEWFVLLTLLLFFVAVRISSFSGTCYIASV